MLNQAIGSAEEVQRLAAVRRYEVLDTPPEDVFDRVTAVAARRLAAPVCYISIVDADRIWFKSHRGIAIQQTGVGMGLCASAILSDDPTVVTDVRTDPRARANPLVAELGLRFYAGVPLRAGGGHNLGALCVMAKHELPISQDDIADLSDLACIVVDQLETRLAGKRAAAQSELMAKEVDHRMMNSLQLVSGLLALQAKSPDLGKASVHLQLAASRVAAVAHVHRHFIANSSTATSCIDFLRRLCGDLAKVLGRTVVVHGHDNVCSSAWIQPIGLLVNELVTNAAKHGEGLIEVLFSETNEGYALSVSDRGKGLPDGFDLQFGRAGLGMPVIKSLAKQLGGALTASNRAGGGAVFKVTFPREN